MDACRVRSIKDGFEIRGTAVYLDAAGPARLTYRVVCDDQWCSRSGSVKGWVGRMEKSFSFARSDDTSWICGTERIPEVDGSLDIDLGFTPATNLNAIKRLQLDIGASAETTAVWLDAEDWTVKPLRQRYTRLSERVFAYASPEHGYRAELVVDAFGWVRTYPDLWQAIPNQ